MGRVNLKFVVGLGAALVLAAIVVVVVGVQALGKPGGEGLVKAGDEAMAAGDYAKAALNYSKAVNKDQRNVEWLGKWLAAVEKQTPRDRREYGDAYQNQYMRALTGLVVADRRNAATYRRYFDERFEAYRTLGAGLAGWEAFLREYEDRVKQFAGDEQGQKSLRRYRAMARTQMLQINPSLEQSDLDAAEADAAAALEADPKDAEAMTAWVALRTTSAGRMIKSGKEEEGRKAIADAVTRMEKFVADNPGAFRQAFELTNVHLAEQSRKMGPKATLGDLFKTAAPEVSALKDRMMAAEPATLDAGTVLGVAEMLTRALQDDGKAADALLARAAQGKSDDPLFLLGWARVKASRGDIRGALELAHKVRDIKDKPLGLPGLVVWEVRPRAMRVEADALFELWRRELEAKRNGSKDAKPEEVLRDLKALRKDLAAAAGEGSSEVAAVDARLAYAEGDIPGARALVTGYNDQTGRADIAMLLLEGEIFMNLKQYGGAKAVYQRVLELDRNNPIAHVQMAAVEQQALNFAESAAHLRVASALMPDNAALKENARLMGDLASADTKDPVAMCLRDAIVAGSGLQADPAKSLKILEDCAKANPREVRLLSAIARMRAVIGDKAGAIAAADEAMKVAPDDERLAALKKGLQEEDPLAKAFSTLNERDLPEWQKALSRADLLGMMASQATNEAGEAERAGNAAGAAQARAKAEAKRGERREAVQAALKAAPDEPAVMEYAFTDALQAWGQAKNDAAAARAKNDAATADRLEKEADAQMREVERLTQRAEATNADKVGGLLYKGRVQAARGQLAEAAVTFEELVKKDKGNLIAWRLLGRSRLQLGSNVEAVDAFRRALALSPSDSVSINGLLEGLMKTGRADEALREGRAAETLMSSDPVFRELLLTLEGSAQGGDKDKAIGARRALVARDPSNTNNKEQLATLLINAKKYDEAEPVVAGLEKDAPADDLQKKMVAVQLRASLEAARGDVAKGVKVLQDFIAAQPEDKRDAALFINGSRLLTLLGQPDAAEQMLVQGRPYQKPESMLIDRELGDLRFGRERFPEAVEAYERVLASSEDKKNAVRKRILESQLRSGKYAEMDATIAKMGPGVQSDMAVLLLQAEAAMEQNDRQRAARLYDQAVSAEPNNPVAYLKRGDFRLTDERTIRDAEADYRRMLELDPRNPLPRLKLVRVLSLQGRDQESVEMIREAIGTDPNNSDLHLALVMRYMELGRLEAAAQAADTAVKQFNGPLDWRLRAGQLWMQGRRWDRAVAHLAEAWKLRQDETTASMYVEALANNGSLEDAGNVLKSLGSNVDKSPTLRLLRARVLARQGRTADAAREMAGIAKEMLRTGDREQVSIFMAGLASMYEKPADRLAALASMERGGLKLTGFLAMRRADLNMSAGDKKAGIAELEALATKDGDKKVQAAAHSLLGQEAYRSGDYPSARQHFEAGIALDPDSPELNNNLAYVLASKLGQGSAAVGYAQKAVKAAPQVSGFHDTLGAACVAASEPDRALEALSMALQLAKNDSERVPVYIHAGRAKLLKKDGAGAREMLDKARDAVRRDPKLGEQFGDDLKEFEQAVERQ